MGYVYAVLSSLLFACYALPKKKAKIKPYYYVFFMGITCFAIAVFMFIAKGRNELVYNSWLLLSVLGGIIWFIASVLFFYSVDKMGVAKSGEFKGLQGPIGSILMLFALREYTNLNILFLLFAIAFIFSAAIILVLKEENKPKIKIKSIVIAILSAVFYALTGFIRKVVTIQGYVYIQQVYTSFGLLSAAIIYLIIKDKKIKFKKTDGKSFIWAILSGAFYYFASYFMLLSYEKIEGSIAFPLIQLNSIWTALIGIFIFKEINYKRYYKRIILGLSLAIIGVTLLVIC